MGRGKRGGWVHPEEVDEAELDAAAAAVECPSAPAASTEGGEAQPAQPVLQDLVLPADVLEVHRRLFAASDSRRQESMVYWLKKRAGSVCELDTILMVDHRATGETVTDEPTGNVQLLDFMVAHPEL
eukprot:1497644-Karenia_brevis.AAC.1